MRTILTDIKSIIITEVTFILLIMLYFNVPCYAMSAYYHEGISHRHIVHAKQQARDNE